MLAHTADTGFRAWAPDLASLFETAALAMFSLEYDAASVPSERSVALSIEADDAESGLYRWLSELIWLHDAEGFVPASIRVDRLVLGRLVLDRPAGGMAVSGAAAAGCAVAGSAVGADLGDWFVQTGAQLKAVTMHGLVVRCCDGACEATVYMDV